jgi:spore maturation protein CgeB
MQPLEPNIPRLRKNLAALAKRDASLAQRLHLPVDDAHVRKAPADKGAGVHYRMGRGWMPLGIGREAAVGLLGDPEAPARVLCFGVGLGELVQAALKRWPKAEIVAWDRDPWLLRVSLGRHDWRGALRAGRLRLALASDLLDHLPWADHVVHHPVLDRVHTMERHLLEHGLCERRAMVVTGELFVGDLADALRHRGYAVIPWEVERHAAEEIAHNARRSGASLAASINYTGGLAEGCSAARLPLICWEIDPALNSARARGATDQVWIFTHDPLNVPRYRAGGFEHVEYMPLAANPRVRAPTPEPIDPRFHAPISFVGSSMLGPASRLRKRFDALLARWAQAAGAGVPGDLVQRILVLQRKHHDRFIVSEALDAALPGFRTAVMAAGEGDPGMMLGESAAAEKRLNIVAGLGPMGVHAWGDDGWKLSERGGAQYRGRAGHSHEINLIYQASGISLDIDRLYQREIVTMRVFDVLACGGFVIAEHSPHLGEVFEIGSELVSWHNPADLERKVRHFLAHPDEAAAIAQRGRARVLRDHTVDQRLEHMLTVAGLL